MFKKKIEAMDYDIATNKYSFTGKMSVFLVICIVITQLQLSQQSLNHKEKLELSAQEKGFRYRQKFFSEITLFVLIMQASVFFALNHSFSVNRKRSEYSAKHKELMSQKKDEKAKKDD